MGELLALRYVGEGAYRPGLPARDLDHADLAGLSDADREIALACGLYKPIFEPDEDEAGQPIDRHAALEAMTKAELNDIATSQGIDVPRSSTNAKLVEAIEANEQRLADEAEASSSGESDEGGDATSGDDPDATATGEPGTPPAGFNG